MVMNYIITCPFMVNATKSVCYSFPGKTDDGYEVQLQVHVYMYLQPITQSTSSLWLYHYVYTSKLAIK